MSSEDFQDLITVVQEMINEVGDESRTNCDKLYNMINEESTDLRKIVRKAEKHMEEMADELKRTTELFQTLVAQLNDQVPKKKSGWLDSLLG
jgi:methyl-accepting chemotaxis protein